jgi:hypothetical protein
MAMTFKIENGKAFEKMLNQIKDLKSTGDASSVIYSAIKSAEEGVAASLKQMTPESKSGSTGWRKYQSRNHKKGTLRDSVKSGLRRKVKGRNIFMGAIFYEDSYAQYYAGFLLNKHNENAFGFGGDKNVMKQAIDKNRPIALSKLESDLMTKLTKKLQKIIDKV